LRQHRFNRLVVAYFQESNIEAWWLYLGNNALDPGVASGEDD
jgi:hypothetical protein